MIGSFSEALKLKRGSELVSHGFRRRVTHVIHRRGGGSGMGESSDTVTVVLEDGSVWLWDSWVHANLQPTEVAKNFNYEDGSF